MARDPRNVDKNRRASQTRPARSQSSFDKGQRRQRRRGKRLEEKLSVNKRHKQRQLTQGRLVFTLIASPTSLARQGVFGAFTTGAGTSSTSKSTASEPPGHHLDRPEGTLGGTSKQAVLEAVHMVHRLMWGVLTFQAQMLFLLRQASH